MGGQGREPNEFRPQDFLDLEPERPMDDGDATGAPTRERDRRTSHKPSRAERELAFRAWQHLAQHDAARPLPEWIADYLRGVAIKLLRDLGPRGSLSPASAHAALALVGEQWPEHHPESVFAIISAWIDPARPDGSLVSGRKAGAVKYIKEYMGNDPMAQVETVIEWYRKGQKASKRSQANENTEGEEQRLVTFDEALFAPKKNADG